MFGSLLLANRVRGSNGDIRPLSIALAYQLSSVVIVGTKGRTSGQCQKDGFQPNGEKARAKRKITGTRSPRVESTARYAIKHNVQVKIVDYSLSRPDEARLPSSRAEMRETAVSPSLFRSRSFTLPVPLSLRLFRSRVFSRSRRYSRTLLSGKKHAGRELVASAVVRERKIGLARLDRGISAAVARSFQLLRGVRSIVRDKYSTELSRKNNSTNPITKVSAPCAIASSDSPSREFGETKMGSRSKPFVVAPYRRDRRREFSSTIRVPIYRRTKRTLFIVPAYFSPTEGFARARNARNRQQ